MAASVFSECLAWQGILEKRRGRYFLMTTPAAIVGK